MRYVFFINPAAGKGNAVEILIPAIKEYFKKENKDYKIIVTEAVGDAMKKAKLEAETGDEVSMFACGGDGTFFEVLNGAVQYKNVSFGVMPYGSGNDFLKVFDNRSPFMSLENQISGNAVPMDIIKIDDTYCMNVCSLGMDAVVADRMKKFKTIPFVSGSMAYKLAIIKLFFGKIGQKAKIWADGTLLGTFDCLFAVCANGSHYGGGYNCAPGADTTDGLLDWLVVENIVKLKIPSLLKKYESGKFADLPFCHFGKCRVLEIEAEKDEPINLDGEIVYKKSVRFEVLPSEVKFILPKGVKLKSDKKAVSHA